MLLENGADIDAVDTVSRHGQLVLLGEQQIKIEYSEVGQSRRDLIDVFTACHGLNCASLTLSTSDESRIIQYRSALLDLVLCLPPLCTTT
jgi:hypothetical protein